MEKHPLPQNIASYEFRLVGSMTLKQFGMLAGGAILAFIFYSAKIPAFFKWPLIVGSFSGGAAFAFVPVNDQPLSRWLTVFLKSMFSPTIFQWHKQEQRLAFSESQTPVSAQPAAPRPQFQPMNNGKLTAYIDSLPQTQDPDTLAENKKANEMTNLFSSVSAPVHFPRKESTMYTTASTPSPKPQAVIAPKPAPIPAGGFVMPASAKMAQPIQMATMNRGLPFPHPPEYPNIITGMVLDKNGSLIEGAILEIKNAQGLPVRALRSNRLGQFKIATPLADGEYQIEIEKNNYSFAIIKIVLDGKIIQPIEIRSLN